MQVSDPKEPSMLYLSDRSRMNLGLTWCPRARYLEFSSGPVGYGIRSKRRAIPLATGSGIHKPLELALRHMKEHGEVPSREAFRPMVVEAIAEYFSLVEKRGFMNHTDDQTQKIMQEQRCLIEGLSWTAWKILLPPIHEHYAVVHVEQEDVLVWDCDCGLGEMLGDYTEHEAKGCGGIGIQVRPDAGLRRRSDSALCVLDWKSDGNVHKYNWQESFRLNIQMAFQVMSLERLMQEPVQGGVFIAGLHKGWRATEKTDQDGVWVGVEGSPTTEKYQASVMCYGYQKPANPPLEPEEWRSEYYYSEWDEKKQKMVGRNLKGKGYSKVGLWLANFPDKPKSWSSMEHWVENYLSDETVAKQVKLAGPLHAPEHLFEALKRAGTANEQRVRESLWALWEVSEATGGEFSHPDFQAALDIHFPQTWDCQRYNTKCQFVPICDRQAGWEDPLGTGMYELRRPHHEAERLQLTSRGVELPPEQDEDEVQE